MKKLVFIAISLTLSSCNLIDFNNKGFIDPEIKPYVDSFVHEAEIRGYYFNYDNLKIVFSSSINSSGLTHRYSKTIKINPNSIKWELYPEELVFHELGHLILDRIDHTNTLDLDGKPISIMNNIISIGYERKPQLREKYLNELYGVK